MALVDYRGYRLLAMSIVPISAPHSLVYGCANAGETTCEVKCDDLVTMQRVDDLCSSLGLASHPVVGGIHLRSPIDLEAHWSRQDGRRYLLDFSRLMPPVRPSGSTGEQLYRLFRPEFVELYSKSVAELSPDAYSPFSTPQPYNQHVDDATTFLLDVHLPRVVHELADEWRRSGRFDVPSNLHRRGVNLRYLGRILALADVVEMEDGDSFANLIATELVARAVKFWLFAEWRATAAKGGSTSELQRVTARCINSIFASADSAAWTTSLPVILLEQFGWSNKEPAAVLFPRVAHTPLLDRVFALAKISLSSATEQTQDSSLRAWKGMSSGGAFWKRVSSFHLSLTPLPSHELCFSCLVPS